MKTSTEKRPLQPLRIPVVGCAIALMALAAPGPRTHADSPSIRILVGPNVQVSADGNVTHAESMLAVNPRNPQNIVGAAVAFTMRNGSMLQKTYASFDGGNTWLDAVVPNQQRFGGVDTQAAFAGDGTAYFLAYNSGISRYEVYRSRDGGLTWSAPLNHGSHGDHGMFAVDATGGRFDGRLYIASAVSLRRGSQPAAQGVNIWHSQDRGATLSAPVEVMRGNESVEPLMILSDGTLVVPMLNSTYRSSEAIEIARSHDGGATFTAPVKIADVYLGPPGEVMQRYKSIRLDSLYAHPVFAADAKSPRFRDSLYAAWINYRPAASRIVVSHSHDGGVHWSRPVTITPLWPDHAQQFQPMIAAAPGGTVGVAWYDTRNSARSVGFEVYFAASRDGGDSFAAPVRVSSATSLPFSTVSLTPTPRVVLSTPDGLIASLWSPYAKFPGGGDYMGFAAGSDNVFHPFWTDARDGTYQMYTAAIRVVTPEQNGFWNPPAGLERRKLDAGVELVLDPPRMNAQTRIVEIPLHLHNTSGQPIYPPITAVAAATMSSQFKIYGIDIHSVKYLNASNGLTGGGAVYDFSDALGTLGVLPPGGITSTVVVRVRPKQWPVMQELDLGLDIYGMTRH